MSDWFYQIENNIPSDAIFPRFLLRSESDVLYVFIKGPKDLDHYIDITQDWSLRGHNSKSADSIWGNRQNNWRNWSYYYYTGPTESKQLAETILYQHLYNLKNNGEIYDFRIRYNFIQD
jgi:hypothetical protein